ncbi:HNH endonuclease [Paraburkholderia sp. C35]|uniref:HNH endonuclease n=1 Tax=Paraburkholderia sp. C35 TaxID=2126993 RepID=UPI000D69A13C|nr:HNH endonuclease [Paraburkholderia sp. C35]
MEWRSCPSWPEYEISEFGGIKRVVKRLGHIGLRKPYLSENGRLMIVMRGGGKKRACHVSRLVAEAFHGPAPTPMHEAAHNDGDCLNNLYKNLRWATKAENEADKVMHGTSNRGERFGRVRLTEAQVIEIRKALKSGESSYSIGPRFGVAASTVRSISSLRSWFWLEEIE